MRAARSAIDNLAPTARVALRPVWGSQDSAFAAALPVGLFLPAHLKSARNSRSRAMRPLCPAAGTLGAHRAAASRPARLVRARAGRSGYLQAPAEWRATTVQSCGLWPFSVGAGAPMVGVPLGATSTPARRCARTRSAGFNAPGNSTAPTAYVLGLNGFGKSTVIRRMAIGLAGFGVLPLVFGDLKPDYVDLIEAMDGQVIRLGRGRGYLNILDMTSRGAPPQRLGDGKHAKLKREVLADALGRRHTMVSALISIQRGQPPDDREDTILAAALRVLDERSTGTPVLTDLIEVIESAPEQVRLAALDRGVRALPGARRGAAGHPPGAARRRADRRDVLAPDHRRRIATSPPRSTSPRSPRTRPSSSAPRWWPAGATGSAPSTSPTRSPRRSWRRCATTSSSSTSCGARCSPATGWSTASTRSPA